MKGLPRGMFFPLLIQIQQKSTIDQVLKAIYSSQLDQVLEAIYSSQLAIYAKCYLHHTCTTQSII